MRESRRRRARERITHEQANKQKNVLSFSSTCTRTRAARTQPKEQEGERQGNGKKERKPTETEPLPQWQRTLLPCDATHRTFAQKSAPRDAQRAMSPFVEVAEAVLLQLLRRAADRAAASKTSTGQRSAEVHALVKDACANVGYRLAASFDSTSSFRTFFFGAAAPLSQTNTHIHTHADKPRFPNAVVHPLVSRRQRVTYTPCPPSPHSPPTPHLSLFRVPCLSSSPLLLCAPPLLRHSAFRSLSFGSICV